MSVEHFARHIRHVLKVGVRDLARTDAINIVELIVAGPKVVVIEENAQVLMRGLAHDARKRVQRGDKRGGAHEFHHSLTCRVETPLPIGVASEEGSFYS